MAEFTENLGLEKPEITDKYDIEKFNSNSDKIDKAVGDLQTRAADIETSIADKVDKTQYASVDAAGVIKLHYGISSGKKVNRSGIAVGSDGTAYVATGNGLTRSGAGVVGISPATAEEIAAGTEAYKPIVPATFKKALETATDLQAVSGVDIHSIVKTGIYSIGQNCTGLPAGYSGVGGGTLIVSSKPGESDSKYRYVNQYIIDTAVDTASEGPTVGNTTIYACELYGSGIDVAWHAVGSNCVYSKTPVQIGTWVDGKPVWRAAIICTPADLGLTVTEDSPACGIDLDEIMEKLNVVTDTRNVLILCEKINGWNEKDATYPKCFSTDMTYNESFHRLKFTDKTVDDNIDYTQYITGYIEFVTPVSNIKEA